MLTQRPVLDIPAHTAPSAGHTQVQEFVIVKDPSTKTKLAQAALDQQQVQEASLLIIVCSNISRSIGRYGKRGKDFYSIIDGAFAAMLVLLTCVNEGIGACFVGAFDDEKVSKILGLPLHPTIYEVCLHTQNCLDNIKSLALEEKDEFFNLSINI